MENESKDGETSLPAGSASPDVKQTVLDVLGLFSRGKKGFALDIARRIKVMDVTSTPADGPSEREDVVVVCEMDVDKDMGNVDGFLHGGAGAFLVDVCSTLALAVVGRALTVSAAINMIYHSPARVGHKLRIINRTISIGSDIVSASTEIWDATDDRLYASGTHVKMTAHTLGTAKL